MLGWEGWNVFMERLGMNGCGVRLLNAGISNPSMHKIIGGKYCYKVNVPGTETGEQ